MASVTTATSEWIQFFKDAGIPAGLAVNYAVSFVDNRVQKNMLMDLSKDIMMDLGITVIGDIISILKHAKQVYRQDMCKMATQAITSGQSSVQTELRRTANTPATRMIANALSRDSPPNTPAHHPDNRAISVTVSNKQAKSGKAVLCRPADEGNGLPVKRRRVTAEMEGKYIINMPKGTTARTARILAQQAKKGNKRMSVFERLGAESKADTTTGSSKATGVFSRLGRADGAEEEQGTAGRVDVDGVEEEEEEEEGKERKTRKEERSMSDKEMDVPQIKSPSVELTDTVKTCNLKRDVEKETEREDERASVRPLMESGMKGGETQRKIKTNREEGRRTAGVVSVAGGTEAANQSSCIKGSKAKRTRKVLASDGPGTVVDYTSTSPPGGSSPVRWRRWCLY
eukprot:XP_014045486.1 PREDICTED: uncharacterized protein C19orf47 homolog [Salmo salar]